MLAPMVVWRVEPKAGELFAGHYRVERPLSAGGMGAVYVVTDENTQRRRALKVMLAELALHADARERFRREAQVGASIRSEHVVEVLDAGIDEATNTPYLVMELLEGEDLGALVGRRGALPPGEVVVLFEQLCHALAAAHGVGVVHRDLKPENLFLASSRRSDGCGMLKILDFGIAKVLAEANTGSATQSIGSPMWMAPEQTMTGAPITPATDIWALGLIAFYLLTGRSYWLAASATTREPMQLLREMAYDPLVPASSRARALGVAHLLPADFDPWFERAVCRDGEQRFPRVDALLDALRRCLPGSLEAGSRRLDDEPAPNLPGVDAADASVATGMLAPELCGGATTQTEAVGTSPAAPTTRAAEAASRPRAMATAGTATLRAMATTTAATAATAPQPAQPARRRGMPRGLWIAGFATAAAAAAAVAVLLLQHPPPPTHRTAATPPPSTATASAAPELRTPEVGLDAIALHAAPYGPRHADLLAASFWLSAAHDFEQAASQPGAPVRWRAAWRFCEGKIALIGGELEAAAQAFRDAIAVDRAWAVPYAGLALALSRLDQFDQALDAAVAAQQRDRDWYVPLSVAASVYARAGKLEDALQEHRRALQKQPDDPALMANVALGCHAVRLDSEAERLARAALEKAPALVAARLLLAERALERNEATTALEEATRAAAEAPRDFAAHVARGDALTLLGNRTEARAAYERALALADQAGGPEARSGRIEDVRTALAGGSLPPPRTPSGPGRTPIAPYRPSHRTACVPGDPLCSDL